MISRDDLVIVVQGKLHKHGLQNIDRYLEYGKIVLAFNDTEIPEELAPLIDRHRGNPDVELCQIEAKPRAATYNQQNCYYQFRTTTAGLSLASGLHRKLVKPPYTYAIKVRCDKMLGNLKPFLSEIEQNPGKLVTSNLHFRPDSACKYHPSDKFVGGLFQDMLYTFSLALNRCEREAILLESGVYDHTDLLPGLDVKCPYPWYLPGMPTKTTPNMAPVIGVPCELPHGYVGAYPEVVLGTSFLLYKAQEDPLAHPMNRAASREIMKKYFRIFRIEDSLPYLNKFGTSQPEHNWVEIHRIEDI